MRLSPPTGNGGNRKFSGVSIAVSGLGSWYEAIEAFDLVHEQDFLASPDALVDLIHNCSNNKDLATGRRLHSLIISHGLDLVTSIDHHLIGMFTSCGSLHDVNLVFNSVGDHGLLDAIISAHVALGENDRALALYKNMLQGGIIPNKPSFACILKACGIIGSLDEGMLVHGQIRRHGLESDAVVGSALVCMYARCGNLRESHAAFMKVQSPNVVTWGALIAAYVENGESLSAFNLYKKMQRDGICPNKIVLLCILKGCSSMTAIGHGREVYAQIVSLGLESDPTIGNSLLDMYTKCNNFKEAHVVFHGLSIKSVVSWNALLVGLVQHGHGLAAVEMFGRMQEEGFTPSAVTYSCALKACGLVQAIKQGTITHHSILTNCFSPDTGIQNALIDMYSKFGCLKDARKVFDCLEKKDVVSCGAMVAGYADHGDSLSALELSEQLPGKGIRLNKTTALSILKACGSRRATNRGQMTHDQLIISGLDSDAVIGSALIDMYAKCGNMEEAHSIFENYSAPDEVTWCTMMGGYTQNGQGLRALELFEQMDIEADAVTLSVIAKACGSIGAMGYGKMIHERIIRSGYESNVVIGSTLIDMYAKCGDLEEAYRVFKALRGRNVVSWCAMITGYAHYGQCDQAVQCLDDMDKQGVKPEGSIYTGILAALGHTGQVSKGQVQFRSMTEDHAITPRMDDYSCIIDLLGRAGQFDDAKEILKKMPMPPDTTVWMSMLIACRKFGHVDLAQQCFEQLVCLEPENASVFTLMLNIYTDASMWDEVEKLKVRRKHINAWKKPGKAWIEVRKRLHEFVVGDTTHFWISKILSKSRRIVSAIKRAGYVPELNTVVDHMSDKEKEDSLLGHCERLAIAFGLLATPVGATIRVTKNLRVCNDCHNATKLISKVEKREIIIVDAHRVHRFLEGSCSCEDYL